MSKPIVAIVGRQNVGKSTLLNRAAGKPIAIVEDLPGTTRDRVLADVSWNGVEFVMVDTGGLEPRVPSAIDQMVKAQVDAAIAEADAIVFVVDVKEGMVPADQDVADMLRKAGKPVALAVNKADNTRLEGAVAEFYRLGLGEPMAISAYHGRRIAELLDRVVSLLPARLPSEVAPQVVKVAIVGRPNVGKSMLLNALLGEERAIVDEAPGTTRDAVDSLLDFEGRGVLFIDTAGIRRRGRIEVGVEQHSVIRTLRAIERADIALLVLDVAEPATAQDTHIAGYIQQAARGVALIVNKWDLIEDKNKAEYDRHVRSQFKFMSYAPLVYISAKLGWDVDKIMPLVFQIYDKRAKRLPRAAVNAVVQDALAVQNLPRVGKRQLKVFGAAQSGVNPPTFTFSVNDAKLVHFSYRRYLENRLRQAFGFTGTPLRLVFKTGGKS